MAHCSRSSMRAACCMPVWGYGCIACTLRAVREERNVFG
eukprot:CAMPEP_0174301530 /NCGR_PEP_ID=MMETSP0809-20121228/59102_1 /TAXON_ID=73025 ORGANISM="Eutreptiella gymnastica-like, Strain CCMP1594" /NCGR_SAMPLE_ID=MMETSP0809 /ASSEMBLY_ACC=CAM_ASM_000658 /LENGTH=38 /DNA_ID= /DNA_START= /DNA_END= /DNA_ORIENTATION=